MRCEITALDVQKVELKKPRADQWSVISESPRATRWRRRSRSNRFEWETQV